MRRPDFIIVGAQKAGTSALLAGLLGHPDVGTNRRVVGVRWSTWGPTGRRPQLFTTDEPHFFTHRFRRGIWWYYSLFPRGPCTVGERTPGILHSALARARLRSKLPDVRVIVLLRDPVARSIAQWNHYNQVAEVSRHWGWQPGTSFDNAMRTDLCDVRKRSMYGSHLEDLLSLFPRRQIHFVLSENMRANWATETLSAQSFLGLSAMQLPMPDGRKAHVRNYATRPTQQVRDHWARKLASEVEAVRKLTGLDTYRHWSSVSATRG